VPLLTWNDSYSVGVKTIDKQHSGLFGMVNELHADMMKGQAQSVVGPLLDKLAKYTVQHFAHEERMMDAAKFPGLATHRAHHSDLTRQVGDFMARYKRGDGTLNIQLLRFLSDWLTRHIQHEDKEYGRGSTATACCERRGQTPSARFLECRFTTIRGAPHLAFEIWDRTNFGSPRSISSRTLRFERQLR